MPKNILIFADRTGQRGGIHFDEERERESGQRHPRVHGSRPREVPANREHHRQQQEHAEELHDHGRVAHAFRHAVARARHLCHVVDGGAEHEPGDGGIEAERGTEDRIGDHGDGGERSEGRDHP